MQPASHFFVKMWPAYETEFETPGLNPFSLKLNQIAFETRSKSNA